MRHDISLNQEIQIISLFINNLGCFLVCLFFYVFKASLVLNAWDLKREVTGDDKTEGGLGILCPVI